MKKLIFFCLFILLTPALTGATTNDFTIKLLSGDDTAPPTTPTLLTVEPMAPDQIDISWSVAADNYLLGGYVLLRDGVVAATTTLTNFSDTGLLPETLYGYEVYAFDTAGNISTTSNILATTTLAIPTLATTSTSTASSGGKATKTVVLDYLNIERKENTALLNWQTNIPSRYALRWGKTDAYTGGYVINEIYQLEHETTITDLEPGTTYLYELIGYTPAGFALVLKKGQFTTKLIPEEKPVANVTKLEVEVIGPDVLLNFALPQGEDIALVRIVRSHLGFPLDSNDGAIIYEGTALNWRDEAALSLYTTQYYSVFAISSNGAISSGAVARASRDNLEDPGTTANASSTASSSPVVVPELPLFGFEVNAIKIRQLQKDFTFDQENIELSYKDSFAISIPVTALPKHLKSIVVTLLDPTDQRKSYSFLLRINKDQTAYEATIAPLYVRGISRLQIEIFDYERMLAGRYRKGISFVVKEPVTTPVVFPDAIVSSFRNVVPTLSVGVFLLGLFLLVLWRRSHKTEDNH